MVWLSENSKPFLRICILLSNDTEVMGDNNGGDGTAEIMREQYHSRAVRDLEAVSFVGGRGFLCFHAISMPDASPFLQVDSTLSPASEKLFISFDKLTIPLWRVTDANPVITLLMLCSQ